MRIIVCSAAMAAVLAAACQKAEQDAPSGAAKTVAVEKPKETAPAEARAEAPKQVPLVSSSKDAISELQQARAMQDNVRAAEQLAHLRKAVALDPDFAQAHIDLAFAAPGDEAQQSLARARALVDKLPEAARLDVESSLAFADADIPKARSICEKLAVQAPGDHRPQVCIGNAALALGDNAAAAAAYEKAIASNPAIASPYNTLAYARMGQRQYEPALAAIDKYVELAPGEPNPHDSRGEILMAAGRYAEAEQAFPPTVKVQAQFAVAWQGVAFSRMLRGDWDGGRAALAEEKKAATDPRAKVGADTDLAMSYLVTGKPGDALKGLAAAEQAAVPAGATVQHASIPLLRAAVQIETGKATEALASVDTALIRARALNRADQIGAVTRNALVYRIYAQSKLGKADAAAATLEQIRAEAAKVPDDRNAQADIHVGAGLVAMARKDTAAAIAELSRCGVDQLFCQWQLAIAQAKAGDKAGAAAAHEAIREGAKRSWQYLFIASRLPKA